MKQSASKLFARILADDDAGVAALAQAGRSFATPSTAADARRDAELGQWERNHPESPWQAMIHDLESVGCPGDPASAPTPDE